MITDTFKVLNLPKMKLITITDVLVILCHFIKNMITFQVTKKQCNELYRVKWSHLSDNKKLKYIIKACDAKKKFNVSNALLHVFYVCALFVYEISGNVWSMDLVVFVEKSH